MNLLKLIKNNLFIQNLAASIVSLIPPYLEFSVAKYQAIKKAMFITAHDGTYGSYLEFGVFTGSSFNFAMKVNKKIEKIFGKFDLVNSSMAQKQIVNLLGLIHLEGSEKSKKKMKTHLLKTTYFLLTRKKF